VKGALRIRLDGVIITGVSRGSSASEVSSLSLSGVESVDDDGGSSWDFCVSGLLTFSSPLTSSVIDFSSDTFSVDTSEAITPSKTPQIGRNEDDAGVNLLIPGGFVASCFPGLGTLATLPRNKCTLTQFHRRRSLPGRSSRGKTRIVVASTTIDRLSNIMAQVRGNRVW